MTIRRKWLLDDSPRGMHYARWYYADYRAAIEAEYAARSGFDVERFLNDIEAIAKAELVM